MCSIDIYTLFFVNTSVSDLFFSIQSIWSETVILNWSGPDITEVFGHDPVLLSTQF